MHAVQMNAFPHINQVEGLCKTDDECMAEVQAVLAKYGKTAKFGITLLHKHFEVSNSEVLVEHCDEVNRVLTCKPISVAELPSAQLIQTAWRFTEAGERISVRDCVKTFNGHA